VAVDRIGCRLLTLNDGPLTVPVRGATRRDGAAGAHREVSRYEVSVTRCLTPRKGHLERDPLVGTRSTCPFALSDRSAVVGPRGYAPDTRARCPWERVRGRVGDGWVGASQRGDARRRDPVPGHARASALRPLRCAFAARQRAEPLLIHRMSAQGDPPRESRRTRRGLPRQRVRACIRRTGPQGFVREMN